MHLSSNSFSIFQLPVIFHSYLVTNPVKYICMLLIEVIKCTFIQLYFE